MFTGFLISFQTSISIQGQEQDQSIYYSHPIYNFGFNAGPGWDSQLTNDDESVMKLTNPNNNMQVYLSFASGCSNPDKCLKRISGIKGLVSQKTIHDTILNKRNTLIMNGICLLEKKPFRKIVIAIPSEEGVYLVELCCPEDCYVDHRPVMRSIMETLRVEGPF